MIRGTTVRAATLAALLLAIGCSGGGGTDPCAPPAIPAGLGCEFWPTVTANAADGDLPFGIALVNPGSADASVHVDGGALGAGIDVTVPARSSISRTLPWVPALKACTAAGTPCTAATGTSVVAAGAAYHVASTQPLAAWQFSPALGRYEASSADATALPGAHALGKSYVAVAWQGGATLPAFVAVTAVEDGTAVTVTSTAAVDAGDLQALEPGAPASATLNRGDVLELLAYGGDLTGTRIVADKPIQAVGGHFCATVPADFPSCDHVEEVLPPTPALGTAYVLAKPVMSTSSKPVVVRVVALEDGTALSYAPGVPGAPGTLDAGQFADFELWLTDGIVEILANRPVLVAEYLAAQGAGGIDGWGDPSLVIAQPVTRWRTAYELHVPDTIMGGWVDVLAPAGGRVTLEGEPLPALRSEGGYALGYANVAGAKRVAADVPFTMWTYGHGSGWSYWYAPAVAP